MVNKKILSGIILLMLAGLAVYFWNNYQITVTERPDKPIRLPSQISGQCGIENCHGLDITCGPEVPEACTAMYAAGDNCRQFASCRKTGNSCQVVLSPEFNDCKSCVEKCERESKDSQIDFFQCESKCTSTEQ
ncbi:hypothetical protein A2Z33_05200 [Candidatus Gottesmanbacteria bacterium RBG_16_52_11]|uniref:Uncharacterized protein n=1 Tax=Candidatus Gottesmanbacteria bacterium RBG_16_52_11 TaxID=1798374 RepID=A0A1F5YR03_9BACT|nr:MAG: hypothetical protein A2Z33_05200 [Candidatus Gottesmanbacteria bacterium RBG_16_52_11]